MHLMAGTLSGPRVRGRGLWHISAVTLLLPLAAGGCVAFQSRLAQDLEREHSIITRRIADMVDRTDRFLGEPRVEDRERKVELALGTGLTLHEEGGEDLHLNTSARIPLPALERKANVFLELGGKTKSLDDERGGEFSDTERSYEASASILARYLQPFSFGVGAGVLWDNGPEGFIRPFLRYESRRDPWRSFVEQQVYFKTNDLFGEKTSGHVDYILTSSSFLRFSSSAEVYQELTGVDLGHTAMHRRLFTTNSALSLELQARYNTADLDAGETHFVIRWQGRVWRDWLEYEIRPRATFPWEDLGDVKYSLLFRLTVLFEDYLRPPEVEEHRLGTQVPE